MIIIKVEKFKNLNAALKVYKNKVQKTKQTEELKNRLEYQKRSTKKRKIKEKAIFNERLKNNLN